MFRSGISHKLVQTHHVCFKSGSLVYNKVHFQRALIVLNSKYSTTAQLNSIKVGSKFHCFLKYPNSFLSNKQYVTTTQVRFYSLPPHTKILLPALSPTMQSGTIIQWQVEEGSRFEPGDLLADIETDKATMGFEAIDEGYIAKIIVPAGTKDIPLGTLVAVSVDNEEDLAAFKNIDINEISSDDAPSSTASTPVEVESAATPPEVNANLPSHDRVLLPALSPTMTTGTIVAWEKQEGDKIDEGDPIATIETDKASMALEYQEQGYLAKILLKEGEKDLPLGTPLCIVVENQEDIAAFANYVDSGAQPPASKTPPSSLPKETSGISPPVPTSTPQTQQNVVKPTGDRLFVSPLAKKLAAEKKIDLNQLAGMGSGPGGRIRAQDLSKVPAVAPSAVTAAPSVQPTPAYVVADGAFVDLPLSNVRKITAQRLFESKQSIPHYYLTVDIEMDKVVELRKVFNKDLESEGIKLSVNDFIIKAASLACLKVPEANSSWRETFIRQFNTVDMSVAVSTDNGLITPIVFDSHSKGLATISKDITTLAVKARDGKLQPQEFQGGTFTISNLGMFGVKHFSAIINPPQACILAVGSARKEVVPDENAEDGIRTATLMSVTLSCDHRVVDGAVGAQWLQQFKKLLEDPPKMLL